MAVCDLSIVDRFFARYTIEEAVSKYPLHRDWIVQYDKYWTSTRHLDPISRTTDLLEIVRYNGWNMNRKRQCQSIQEGIAGGHIPEEDLAGFWTKVDSLSEYRLRDLPICSTAEKDRLRHVLNSLWYSLVGWHSSAGTLCFLSKVILMFNWGQTPAFDTRVRKVLGLGYHSGQVYVQALCELGEWVLRLEAKTGVYIESCVTSCVNKHVSRPISEIPIGRAIDMMLFPLAD